MTRNKLDPLESRQLEALKKTANIDKFKFYLDMNDFLLSLATKGGRKHEMQRLAKVFYGAARKEREEERE